MYKIPNINGINEIINKEILNSESNIEEVLNKDISLPHVNITNRAYKAASSHLLSQLLKKIGFKNESGSIFKFDQKKYEGLQYAIQNLESFNKNSSRSVSSVGFTSSVELYLYVIVPFC
jgi:hypothetical protein